MKTNAIKVCSSVQLSCHHCDLFQLCQIVDDNWLNEENNDLAEKVFYKYERGDYLFKENKSFNSVFAIHSGSVKTCISSSNGKEQVTGFHLQGDLLGLNEVISGYFMESAIALETISVCKIPFKRIVDSGNENSAVQHMLLNSMSKELQYAYRHLNSIAREPAESRLAGFLVNMSTRFQELGFSATEFNLSMTRGDIASLLGMAVETVSRLFSNFQEKGFLSINQRSVQLHNLERLKMMTPMNYNNSILKQDKAG